MKILYIKDLKSNSHKIGRSTILAHEKYDYKSQGKGKRGFYIRSIC